MIYRNILGDAEPKASISVFGGENGQPKTGGYFSLHSLAEDIPTLRWDYDSNDVSHIVAEMEEKGWKCKVRKDIHNQPVIDCVHRETQAVFENEQINLEGEFEEGYIRYGSVPENGKSVNKISGEEEPGVSVYKAKFYANGFLIEIPWYSQGTYLFIRVRRPVLRVWGEEVGFGSDGEVCLRVYRVEQIDH